MSAQILPFVAQLVDRVLLTGLLVQRLGVSSFERWSLITATLSILTMLDLGAQTTFLNKMALAAGAGNKALAARIYRESNTIFAVLAAIVALATMMFVFVGPVQHFLGFDENLSSTDRWVSLFIGGSLTAKMLMANSTGAYRANAAYAKGTMVFSVAELARSMLVVVAVILDPGLFAPAVTTLVITSLFYNFYVPFDLQRRFPDFRFRLAWPTPVTTHRAFLDSLLYASSYLPSIVLTQIPVLIIGSHGATGMLAGFLVMRTFTNLLRSVVQRFASVVGMELGSLESQNRPDEMSMLYRHACLFAAVAFGFTTGFLLGWGDEVVRLWTGTAHLYDPIMLAVMLAPLAIAPGTQIAGPFLTFSQRPQRLALAVALQTVVAALLAKFLPVEDIALRFALAIYGAELLCLPPLLFPAAAKAIGAISSWSALKDGVIGLSTAVATWGLAAALRNHLAGPAGLAVGGLALGLLVTPLLYFSVRPLVHRALRAQTGEATLEQAL